MAITPIPRTPPPTEVVEKPFYQELFDSWGVAPWLIACTAIVCLLIIALIITTIVLCYKDHKGEIYNAEQADQNDNGTVEIRSIYSVQKSQRPKTATR